MRRFLATLLPKSWRARYYRQEAGRAALALLLAPREEVEMHRIREYFEHVSQELKALERA